jgi:hypothetical protein
VSCGSRIARNLVAPLVAALKQIASALGVSVGQILAQGGPAGGGRPQGAPARARVETARVSGQIMLLVGAASRFAWLLSSQRLPQALSALIQT